MKRWIVCISLLLILSLIAGITMSCGNSTPTTSSSPAASQPASSTSPVSTNPVTSTSQVSTQPTSSATGNKIILKLSVGIPKGDPMVDGLYAWADDFNKVANGRAEMQIFPGGVLGGEQDAFTGARTRAFEMAHTSIPVLVGYDPIFGVANLPYILDTYEADNEFCYQIKPYMSKIMETKFNQKFLSSFCMGFAEVYTVKKQVKVMEDFKGLLIACDKAIDAKTAQLLGGSPVTMEYMDEFPSLQKGVVNAGMATAGGALGFMKYYEVIKYLTVSSKSPGQLGVTINLDAYNSLPADLQKAIVDEGNKYQSDLAPVMKKFYLDSFDTIQKNGVTVYNLPTAERDRWRTTCAPIITDYWNQVGPDAAATLQAALKAANAKYPYTGQ